MRLVVWNCNMALDRKIDVLLGLDPDIAVVCECAEPGRLRRRGRADSIPSDPGSGLSDHVPIIADTDV